MTKLEEKLIELGYNKTYGLDWKKLYGKANIIIKKHYGKIVDCRIPELIFLEKKEQELIIDEMKKDLEVLKKYE